MTTLAYGSWCTGYDGIGMGLRLAGLPIVPRWHAEIEPSVAQLLKADHPGVPNAGDVKIAPWQLAPHVDVASSGDPCQSISIAGRRLGREDPRFLWPWVRHAYRQVRPGAIFFENVANIVSHDGGRTLAERFEHLRADGYAVRWTVLGACAVGAPHHRHRWHAVAGYVGANAPEAVRVGGAKAICGAPRSGGRWLLPSPMARDADGRGEGSPEYWASRGDRRNNGAPLGAVVNLLPSPTSSDCFGPGRGPAKTGGDNLRTVAAHLLPTPLAGDADKGQRSIGSTGGLSLAAASRPDVWGKYAEAVALWEQVTGMPAPAPSELSPRGSRRLNPALPEWMMGLPAGFLSERLSRADALKAAGNGVVPAAAAAAWRLLTC